MTVCEAMMNKPYRVGATWADGTKCGDEFDSLNAAQQRAALWSRVYIQGAPGMAVVYEGMKVIATWHGGEKERAK